MLPNILRETGTLVPGLLNSVSIQRRRLRFQIKTLWKLTIVCIKRNFNQSITQSIQIVTHHLIVKYQ